MCLGIKVCAHVISSKIVLLAGNVLHSGWDGCGGAAGWGAGGGGWGGGVLALNEQVSNSHLLLEALNLSFALLNFVSHNHEALCCSV